MSDTNGRKRAKEKVGLKSMSDDFIWSTFWLFNFINLVWLKSEIKFGTSRCLFKLSMWLKHVRWCQFISSIWPENTTPIKNSLLWWSTKDFISKALAVCRLTLVYLLNLTQVHALKTKKVASTPRGDPIVSDDKISNSNWHKGMCPQWDGFGLSPQTDHQLKATLLYKFPSQN